MISRQKVFRVLVVQRTSLSHGGLFSRSIGARFSPLLKYMRDQELIDFTQILEGDITLKDLAYRDVVLFNKHSSGHAIQIMKMSNEIGLRTIYDLDDWILDLPEYSVTDLLDDQIGNIAWMIRNASIVTVSSEALLEKLLLMRTKVFLIKNAIDPFAITSKSGDWPESKKPKILFSNTDGLKLINFKQEFIDVLKKFMNMNGDITIDYWGDIFPELYQIPRVHIRGFLENHEYKKAIANEGYWFAIVPLGGVEEPESLFFNSCKSCIKYIDYGALGIPGIYSNSPVYNSEISHRLTGLLVDNNSKSWSVALSEMLESSSLRRKIREGAYMDVVNNHKIEESSQIFIDLLKTD